VMCNFITTKSIFDDWRLDRIVRSIVLVRNITHNPIPNVPQYPESSYLVFLARVHIVSGELIPRISSQHRISSLLLINGYDDSYYIAR
jgi:hypothetical protein